MLDRIAEDWIALQPATRPDVAYHALEGGEAYDDPEAGALVTDLHADRGFFFAVQSRSPVEEAGETLTRARYEVQATLLVGLLAIGRADVRMVLTEEIAALARAVEGRTEWPAGTIEVLTGQAALEVVDEETGLAAATLNLSCYVEEVD